MAEKSDQPLIYVVDDDEPFTVLVKRELAKAGFTNVKLFTTAECCTEKSKIHPDIVFLDYTLGPDLNGLDVLKKIKEIDPEIYVIMFTAAERIELAIDSLRLGAYDYIIKNTNAFVKIVNRIKKIIKEKQLKEKSR